jgi:hypothetical protein
VARDGPDLERSFGIHLLDPRFGVPPSGGLCSG